MTTRDFIGAGFLAPYLPAWNAHLEQGQRWHFDSLAALAEAVPTAPPPRAWERDIWTDARGDWYGASVTEARRLAREGWPEGAARVRAITDQINLNRPQLPRLARWDVAGSVASVPRYLAGNPMAMRRTTTTETRRRPVVTLVTSLGAAQSVKPGAFIQSAAIAAAMVDRLESAGFRVEVIGAGRNFDHIKHQGAAHTCARQTEIAFTAKRAEDALDLEALAFSLGHPSMSRRFLFAIVQLGRPTRRDGHGVGAFIRMEAHPDRPAGTFFLPLPGTYQGDDLAAFDQACRILRSQDCPGIPETLAA